MLTYGQVKDALAVVVEGGVTSADPRMIGIVNGAMNALAHAMPRGVFVGATSSTAVALDANNTFPLPASMDVVLSLDPITGAGPVPFSDYPSGWINLAAGGTMLDPDDMLDLAVIDLGVNSSGVRTFNVPERDPAVAQYLAYGLLAFAPVVDDTTIMFIQNIEAIKFWILSIYKGQRTDDPDGAVKYRTLAVQELTAELQRHLDDPMRYANRLARWRADATTFPDGTLGNISARLALDFANGQKLGRIKIYRMVNEAAREATLVYNDLGKMQRYMTTTAPNQLTYTLAVNPSDVLSYQDYEALSYLVKAQASTLKPEEAATGKAAAKAIIERNLGIAVDTARATARFARIADNPTTLGYVSGRMGLELPNAQLALTYSDNEFARWINEATRQAVLDYNFLGRSERYSNVSGPNQLTYTPVAAFTDVLSYADYEVLSLLVRAQMGELTGTQSDAARAEAKALIERNLSATVEAQRNTNRNTRLEGTDPITLGFLTARMGMELPTASLALEYSDDQFRRWVNEAARQAVQQFNFLGRSERYSNVSGPTSITFAYATNDAADVSYTDYETLSLLVRAQIAEARGSDSAPPRAEAKTLIERNIATVAEAARNTARNTRLSRGQTTFGFITGKMGLELPTASGALEYSDDQFGRWVNEAARQAITQYNFLGRSDRYSTQAGPISMTFTPAVQNDDIVSYADYEVLSLLVRAQILESTGAQSDAARTEAKTLIERNLATACESARTAARYARLVNGNTTIGYLTGRLGLESPDAITALTISDNQLYRIVNEAAREALQVRNHLTRTERYSNLPGPEPADFLYAVADTDVVSYPDLEVLRRYVAAQVVEDAETARGLRAEGALLVERNLQKFIEAQRNQQWQCLLVSNPFPQFGGARAQLALEFAGDAGTDGYKLSDEFAARIVQEAWAQAVSQYNFLSRDEDYAENFLAAPAATPADTDMIPFSLEVIKLYAEALLCQDKNEAERATSYKQQATELVQRDLEQAVERANRIRCQQQATLPENTFGYVVGALGLDLPNGITLSDAKRRRMANQAEQVLADSGRWKFMEGEYFLVIGENGLVVLPADVEQIIFAEWCGHALELKQRKWRYTGIVTRIGDNWLGWERRGTLSLYYVGLDAEGNSNWKFHEPCIRPPGNIPPTIRALCRRKWVPKVNDTDLMLVQNYPAMQHMVMSFMDKAEKDYSGAAIKSNSALKALDNQLNVETEGQQAIVTVNLPGLRHAHPHGRHGRRF